MLKICLLIIALLIAVPQAAAAMGESAQSACLMNAVTGEIVFEKNADAELPMASTTKIMTLLAAMENSEPDESVTIPHEAVTVEGSSAYLEDGAVMRMEDLWYGLMLNSGNDAAAAIAYHISGSEDAFAELMNKTAAKLGLKHTRFKNPSGLDTDGHYTTAKDLAKLTQYALNNENFRTVVGTVSHTAAYTRADGSAANVEYINHNRLLRELEGCIGVKTGFTKADGRCLVSAAERGEMRFIAVTLNDPSDWAEHKEMLEAGFAGVHMVTAVKKGDCVRHVVRDGNEQCRLVAAEDFNIPVSEKRADGFEVVINLPDKLDMPLGSGEKVGQLDITNGTDIIGTVDITADRALSGGETVKTKHCFWFFLTTLLRNIL